MLDRAIVLGRVLFTQDDDLLQEAALRQRQGKPFAGVIYAQQQNITMRRTIEDLELIAKACEPGELENCVVFLPLKQEERPVEDSRLYIANNSERGPTVVRFKGRSCL